MGLCCYQLFTPGVLFGMYDYDDGVYFGAAVRLSNGVFPYRDFILAHPPGIAVILLPIAFISHLIGTDNGLGLARALTAVVASINVILVGVLVRHRGTFTVFAASALLACFPLSVAADNTVLLEPYLACGCLLGLVIAFDGDHLAERRRVVMAGVCFGVAGSVKIWAVFPVVALSLFLIFRHRPQVLAFLAGVASGFAIVCAPFIVLGPAAFVRDVISSQWLRQAQNTFQPALATRALRITGLSELDSRFNPHAGFIVAAVFGTALLIITVAVRPRRELDVVLLACTASVLAAVLVARQFYAYYSYLPATFIAPLGALTFSTVVTRIRRSITDADRTEIARATRWLARAGWSVTFLVIAVLVPIEARNGRRYVQDSLIANPSPVIDAAIAPGQCALSLESIWLLVANRFTPSRHDCPALVDSYATWIALSAGSPPSAPPYSPALVTLWQQWLNTATYVIYGGTKVPFSEALRGSFETQYRLLVAQPQYSIYVRSGH